MIRLCVLILFFACCAFAANAATLVKDFADKVVIEETGSVLTLRGWGVLKEDSIPMYQIAFYSLNPLKNTMEVLKDSGSKRLMIIFLKGDQNFVNNTKLAITKNNPPKMLSKEQISMSQFLKMIDLPFQAGDTLIIDYVPDVGTKVVASDSFRGIIQGQDFFNLIVKIWLGRQPPSQKLKQDLFNLS